VVRRNIIISVPNCFQEPEFRLSGLAYHHWIDRTHRQEFTAETLRLLLEQNGFEHCQLSGMNPIAPEMLCLRAWRLPPRIARLAGNLCRRAPLRRQYFMTILAVAAKVG
jgi:hypothetical protein